MGRVGVIATSKSARTSLYVTQRRWLTDARRSLWFKPSVAVLLSLMLGAVVSQIDVSPGSSLWPLAFHGTSNDARQVLTVIIGALIPVTSLVFALTVVTLQIASTQFSPRLLRTFLRDHRTQLVLSALVGTVAYCVAGLFTVNTETDVGHVPRMGVTVAVALAVACIGLLVYYFGHITNAVRIDTIMCQVESDTRTIVRQSHPPLDGSEVDADWSEPIVAPAHAVVVPAPIDGYVQGVDARLPALTVRKRISVLVVPLIGYYTMAGRPLALVWSDDEAALTPSTLAAIANLVEIDLERRVERDVGLGLRQLVDITNRAMSTGQNDPYTGTQAVHHLTTVLADAIRRSFTTQVYRDQTGVARVIVPVMDFPTHLKVVCGHIRQGGLERHPRVVLELLRMLDALAEIAPTARRAEAIRREVELVMEDAKRVIPCRADLADAVRLGDDVVRTLDAASGTSPTPPTPHISVSA
jgi:uncharacterized membrane protein